MDSGNEQKQGSPESIARPSGEQFSRWRTVGLMTGLMLAVLLTLMDQTVVSTALPTVVSDLGGLTLYAWVFSAYLLVQTSFLPIFGKLSDLYGRRCSS